MKIKFFFDRVYRIQVLFISGCSWKEANKAFAKKTKLPSLPDDHFSELGVTYLLTEEDFPSKIKGTVGFIWVRKKIDLGTLTHELCHLVIGVLDKKAGMEINSVTSEAFAYYYDFWLKTIWLFINEK